ncbi:MAG: ribosomal-processing cysteine protease Prp [Spirochaetes bacterium]|nr:ribosomal-processing cysteine protease Prp [Spirochaetota bacterium]
MVTVIFHNIVYDERLRFTDTGSGEISVTVTGHAVTGGSGQRKGENLVCAAVSALALTLLRSITIIANIRPEYAAEDGFMEFRIRIGDLDAQRKNTVSTLLESFMIGMLDVQKSNPDYIEIRTVIDNIPVL